MAFMRVLFALSAMLAMVASFTMPKSFLHKVVNSQSKIKQKNTILFYFV